MNGFCRPSPTTSLCCVLFHRPWIPKRQVSNTQNFFKHNPRPLRLHIRNGNELPNLANTHTRETANVGARRKTILKIIYDDAFKGRKIHFIARGTVVIGKARDTRREKPKTRKSLPKNLAAEGIQLQQLSIHKKNRRRGCSDSC